MDIQMPVMNGYDAATQIRSSNSLCANVPIVALTANVDTDTTIACAHAKMNDIVTKPFRRKTLLASLNRWLCQNEQQETADDTEPVQCSSDKPFDFEMAVEEFGGNSEVVSSLIEKFIEEAETQIKNITDALEGQDNETMRKEAHKIRGAAGNLVAMPLSLAAENLEELVKSGDIDNAAEKVKELQEEFMRLKEYV
jgi:HPt (histidine-containing phosphotransfer) domain-containing protein